MNNTYCVYFFRNKQDELLYIGKTSSFKQRMTQHFSKAEMEAEGNEWKSTINKESIQVFSCENSTDLEIYETYFINKYNPRHNKDKVYGCTPSFDLPYLEGYFFDFIIDYKVKDTNLLIEEFLACDQQTREIKLRNTIIGRVNYLKIVDNILAFDHLAHKKELRAWGYN